MKHSNSEVIAPLGPFIKKWRRERGWTQQQLAERLGRERSWVAHLERGSIQPSLEQLAQLGESLQVSTQAWMEAHCAAPAGADQGEQMRRKVVRSFANSWRYGYRVPQHSSEVIKRSWMKLRGYLETIADEVVRAKLAALQLGFREAVWVAQAMLANGAQWARLSLANVGFPVALIDAEMHCINHVPRPCLVWAGAGRSLALFGESYGASPAYIPPVLAWADENEAHYLFLDDKWAALDEAGQRVSRSELPMVKRDAAKRNHSLGKLLLRDALPEQVSAWVRECACRKP